MTTERGGAAIRSGPGRQLPGRRVAALTLALLLSATLPGAAAASPDDFSAPEPGEALSGGAATSGGKPDRRAFSRPAGNLPFERRLDFRLGEALFEKLWVSSPSSTTASDGLGPLYNARACQRCHIKGGRGHPPGPSDGTATSMLVRLSLPSAEAQWGSFPEPTYGSQLQTLAIQGHAPEARVAVDYRESEVALADGETVTLRRPRLRIETLAFGPLAPGTRTSARVAPPMIGLGLLEAVAESAILAAADPEDADGDGISGRPNRVWSDAAGRTMLGRFGWKAGQPDLRQQIAAAFASDIGIGTSLYPAPHGDCTAAQGDCRAAPDGNTPRHDNLEASDEILDLLLFYAGNLGVPARRDTADPQVLAGKRLFHDAGCAACHRPLLASGGGPGRAGQAIRPYSDLLLHDMGEGLADGGADAASGGSDAAASGAEASASGREWRTPPLWGIGLTEVVNGHTLFLHDGRARDLLEAVLWHGGEAEAARDRVVGMSRAERDALLRFLKSL